MYSQETEQSKWEHKKLLDNAFQVIAYKLNITREYIDYNHLRNKFNWKPLNKRREYLLCSIQSFFSGLYSIFLPEKTSEMMIY